MALERIVDRASVAPPKQGRPSPPVESRNSPNSQLSAPSAGRRRGRSGRSPRFPRQQGACASSLVFRHLREDADAMGRPELPWISPKCASPDGRRSCGVTGAQGLLCREWAIYLSQVRRPDRGVRGKLLRAREHRYTPCTATGAISRAFVPGASRMRQTSAQPELDSPNAAIAEPPMCSLAARSAVTCKRTWLSLAAEQAPEATHSPLMLGTFGRGVRGDRRRSRSQTAKRKRAFVCRRH